MLQHGATLSLDQRYMDSETALHWYGIEVPAIAVSYESDNHFATLIGNAIYFDQHRLPGAYSNLAGIAAIDTGFAIATSSQLLLITDNAELIEVLASIHGVPPAIAAIGVDGTGQIYLRVAASIVTANLDTLDWSESDTPAVEIRWSETADLSGEISRSIEQNYAAALLSWERVILDIHSGRLLGRFGVVLVDIMAILFVFMAATGLWIWSRRQS